jgi:RecB family exonuclease
LEEVVNETIEVPTSKGVFKFRLGGIIDRMDIKEGTLRIIDYKTGGDPVSPESVEVLFTPKEKRGNYVFQIFLYSSIMQKEYPGQTIEPLLLYINKAGSKDFNPHIRIGYPKSKSEITEFQPFESEFREYLIKLVSRLFDVGTPFKQTEIQTFCQFCGYKSLCRR